MKKDNKVLNVRTEKQKRLIYYIIGVSLPIIQFCIFYFGVNFNSLLLAFQKYEVFGPNAGKYVFNGFNNFVNVAKEFVDKGMINYIWRGLLIFGITVVKLPVELLFAYYISKKRFGYKLFTFILYVPQMISGLVMSLMYKYFVCECIPEIGRLLTHTPWPSFLDTGDAPITFSVLLFFNIFLGFGANLLIFSGAMSAVSTSVVEAAKIDGVTAAREFVFIYFPLVWPTVSTMLVMQFAGVLTCDIGLYAYFGAAADAELRTLGYELTMRTQTGGLRDYPFLAAMGLMITAITIPIVFIGKKLMSKIDDKFAP